MSYYGILCSRYIYHVYIYIIHTYVFCSYLQPVQDLCCSNIYSDSTFGACPKVGKRHHHQHISFKVVCRVRSYMHFELFLHCCIGQMAVDQLESSMGRIVNIFSSSTLTFLEETGAMGSNFQPWTDLGSPSHSGANFDPYWYYPCVLLRCFNDLLICCCCRSW